MKKAFEDMTTYGYSRLITDLCLFVVAYRCYSRPFKNRRSFDFPGQSFLEACLYRFHTQKTSQIQIQNVFLDFQFLLPWREVVVGTIKTLLGLSEESSFSFLFLSEDEEEEER